MRQMSSAAAELTSVAESPKRSSNTAFSFRHTLYAFAIFSFAFAATTQLSTGGLKKRRQLPRRNVPTLPAPSL